jgi:hypothetical protein
MTHLACWSFALLLVCPKLRAQAGIIQPCPSDALSITFQAADGPDHNYTLAINKGNISAETCFVDSQTHGAGFSPDVWPDGSRVKVSYDGEAGKQRPSATRINLAPGNSVHQTRTWTTSPAAASTQCVTPTEMTWEASSEWNNFVRLLSPSLLKQICSTLVNSDYTAGPYFPQTTDDSKGPRVQWDNDDHAFYSRNHIPLRVRVDDPDHTLLLDQHSCTSGWRMSHLRP